MVSHNTLDNTAGDLEYSSARGQLCLCSTQDCLCGRLAERG